MQDSVPSSQQKHSLVTVVACRFSFTFAVGVLLITISALVYQNIYTDVWLRELERELIEIEEDGFSAEVNVVAANIALQYASSVADINATHYYAEQVFNGKLPIRKYYPNFYGVNDSSCPYIDPNVSELNEYSVWYSNRSCDESDNMYLQNSSILDNVHRVIKGANPYYIESYLGTVDGMFRSFPHRNLENLATLSYTCAGTDEWVRGFDPRCASWYWNSVQDPTEVFFYGPLESNIVKSLTVVLSRAVHRNTTIIGAVAWNVDLSIVTNGINDVGGKSVGYNYVIDSDGLVVLYNGDVSPCGRCHITEAEFGTKVTKESMAFDEISIDVVLGNEGSSSFRKNNKKFHMHFAPVEGSRYRYVSIIPDAVVVESTDVLVKDITNLLFFGTLLTLLIAVVVIAIGGMSAIYLAAVVVKPINDFNDFSIDVGPGKLDIELGNVEGHSHSDIVQVGRRFRSFIEAMTFSNKEFYAHNIESAYESILRVEAVMREINNPRGLSVVLSNKANILLRYYELRDHLSLAKKCFDIAILEGHRAIETCTTEEDERYCTITLAGRYGNLGAYYMDTREYDNSIAAYEMAIMLHGKAADKIGEIRARGNLGKAYLDMGRLNEADEIFREAFDCAVHSFASLGTDRAREVLQYASMNMGILLCCTEEYEEARKFFTYSLELSKTIHRLIKLKCLKELSEVYMHLSHPDAEEMGNSISQDLTQYDAVRKRHFHFLVDVSSRMTNETMAFYHDKLFYIITNLCTMKDYVSATVYNNNTRRIVSKEVVGRHRSNLLQRITRETYNFRGTASFYDALERSIVSIRKDSIGSGDQWIIALSNARDNSSVKDFENLPSIIQRCKINIVMITDKVFWNLERVDRLLSACRFGLRISQEGGEISDIKRAFEAADSSLVTVSHTTMETL
mmetsp:Transcript_23890/g.35053  ORF Transcript_23890/g.35053 Transcript_23890/m.35053 type:complete len:908 (-) Transcript_23890:45-2768(-)